MTMRHLGPAARAARRAPVPSGHLGVDAGFVNEDEFLWVKMWLLGDPGVAPCGYVVTVLFAGVRRLFFSVMWCRRKNSWTVLMAKCSPRSLTRRPRSSARVMSGVS